jgi:AbiV family abortive infection protein
MILPTDALMKGSWFALEQCGHLLQSAALLYRAGQHSCAVGLAMLAREELGRYRILRDLWHEATETNRAFDAEEVRSRLDDHVEKQRAALFSLTYEALNDTHLAKLFTIIMRTPPSSPEHKAAREELEEFDKRRAKRIPHDRHEDRMKALYVDLDLQSGVWNRPHEAFSRQEARRRVEEALNDYRVQYDPVSRRVPNAERRPGLNESMERWADKPELPLPPGYLPE